MDDRDLRPRHNRSSRFERTEAVILLLLAIGYSVFHYWMHIRAAFHFLIGT